MHWVTGELRTDLPPEWREESTRCAGKLATRTRGPENLGSFYYHMGGMYGKTAPTERAGLAFSPTTQHCFLPLMPQWCDEAP